MLDRSEVVSVVLRSVREHFLLLGFLTQLDDFWVAAMFALYVSAFSTCMDLVKMYKKDLLVDCLLLSSPVMEASW